MRTHRDPTFQYARVPPRALIFTLRGIATGRQATDRIGLLKEMQTYFENVTSLPQYINMLEDLQKKALRIDRNDPITEATILTMAVTDVIKSGQFPRLEEDWTRVPPPGQTWQEWKRLALAEYERVEARLAAQGGGNSFGGAANMAANPPGTDDDGASNPAPSSVGMTGAPTRAHGNGLDADALSEIESALDNFACAARTEQDAMAELIKSNAALVAANQKLTDEVIKAGGLNRNMYNQLTKLAKLTGQPAPAPLADSTAGRGRGGRAGRGSRTGQRAGGYTNKTERGPGGAGACSVCGWSDHPEARCYEKPENAGLRPSNWKSCL